MSSPSYIVFTDLDGTLLDHHTYSHEQALPGLELLRRHNIPVVFCSAKTRTEQLAHRNTLQIHDPFIVENGGAIFAETGYFRQPHGFRTDKDGLEVLALARPYAEVRRVLSEVRTELNLAVRGYGDMTAEEVAGITGLDLQAAARAKQREFAETIVTRLSELDRDHLRDALARHGVSMVPGARFISISTANDKGRAVRSLIDVFRKERGEIVSVGIGDSWNDAPLLAATDVPMLVQQPGGDWAALPVKEVRKIPTVGPKGWTQAVHTLLESRSVST